MDKRRSFVLRFGRLDPGEKEKVLIMGGGTSTRLWNFFFFFFVYGWRPTSRDRGQSVWLFIPVHCCVDSTHS